MGVIGMKVYAAGTLLRAGSAGSTSAEAMGYVLSLPGVSTVIIGCSSPAEVDDNARIARAFQPFDGTAMRAIEERIGPRAGYLHLVQEAGIDRTPAVAARCLPALASWLTSLDHVAKIQNAPPASKARGALDAKTC